MRNIGLHQHQGFQLHAHSVAVRPKFIFWSKNS